MRIHSNVLRKRVEQFRNRLVAAESVHQNPVPVEKRHVHLAVDDSVHEEYVRGDVVSCFRVEPLEGDQVQEHVLGGVVHNQGWEPKHAAAEGDVAEAVCAAFHEADSGVLELCCGADDLVVAVEPSSAFWFGDARSVRGSLVDEAFSVDVQYVHTFA